MVTEAGVADVESAAVANVPTEAGVAKVEVGALAKVAASLNCGEASPSRVLDGRGVSSLAVVYVVSAAEVAVVYMLWSDPLREAFLEPDAVREGVTTGVGEGKEDEGADADVAAPAPAGDDAGCSSAPSFALSARPAIAAAPAASVAVAACPGGSAPAVACCSPDVRPSSALRVASTLDVLSLCSPSPMLVRTDCSTRPPRVGLTSL